MEKAYRLIKKHLTSFKSRNRVIKTKEGKHVIDTDEIADDWKQYVEELYSTSERIVNLESEEDVGKYELRPSITKDEFNKALQDLKSHKAYG